MRVQLLICDTCAALGAAACGADWALQIARRVKDENLPVHVKTTSCLNICDAPIAFALQGDERATYLFAGAVPQKHDDNLIALLRLYLAAPDGWITDARGMGDLRANLQGRVPRL